MATVGEAGRLGLLRANAPFRRLWSARAISFLGDSLSLVALMLYIAESSGEALAVALLLLVGDFAPALLGPLTGALSDRFDHRRVMVVCELVQGGVLVVVAVWLPALPWLLALVACRAIAGQVFQPASRAIVPALVPDERLEDANAAVGFGTNGGEALGPLAAAVLLPWVGVRGVLFVDAATFAVSALLLRGLPSGAGAADEEPSALLTDTWQGLRYIAAAPVVRVVTLGFFAVVACNGVDDVALVFLATGPLGGGSVEVAVLLAAVGIGLFAGYLLLVRVSGLVPLGVLLVIGFAVSSAGNLLTGLAWGVGAAFTVQAVRGLGIAAMDVAANTLIQRTVPPGMLGRVFGAMYGAIGVAAALSYVCGGLLLDAVGPRAVFVAAGAGGLAATAGTGLALWRAVRRGAATTAGVARPGTPRESR
ncbi:MFS transporter [Yinghuangia seranimata]|uniref:MFS transporter n=1 Tax=Yinghuangia seranimata TaxID=408067 RepID=UPI00248B5770|nr:MFS transporter [Yinghuangia seranimata]MDI2132122.1 MFS transporter [Yinghuangia seranimata]